jgi:two-component system phosphate regulon sensor histidine kinase PhoR
VTIAQQRRFGDALLDTLDVGLAVLDEAGTVATMNHRREDVMRLAYPDGRGGASVSVFGVYGTTPLTPDRMPERRAIADEEFGDCLIWVGPDPVKRRALSVSARAVRGEAGELVGATLARQDVTEFMRALRVKDEFAASVSHELRTPRTSIRGYLDLVLDEDGLSDETRALLRVAARNGDPLQRLVADLLHMPQTDADSAHVGPRTGRPCGGRA